MKTKISLLLMFLLLAGCQPKSEIDKCVEAEALQWCNSLGDSIIKALGGEEKCVKLTTDKSGGDTRLKCLKAQAGKD